MPQKLTPEARVYAYPRSAINQFDEMPFHINDRLGELARPGWGDGIGGLQQTFTQFNGSNPTAPIEWAAQPNFTAHDKVEFVRFESDGRVYFGNSQDKSAPGTSPDIAGYIVQARVPWLDNQIGSNAGVLDGGNTDQNWTAVSGTWKTVLPPAQPAHTCIYNTGSDTTAEAETTGTVQSNRSVGFDVHLTTSNGSLLPSVSISLGNTWGVWLANGYTPSIIKKEGGVWSIVSNCNGGPVINASGGQYDIQFRRIAGRLVFVINGMGFWLLDVRGNRSSYAGQNITTPIPAQEVTWPTDKIRVQCQNIHARIGLRVYKYSEAGGALRVGTFSREVSVRRVISATGEAYASGWQKEGATIGTVVAMSSGTSAGYTCTLTPNADGIDTPMVNSIMARWEPTWTAPAPSSVNLQPGVKSIRVSCALPPLVAGAEATIQLDRVILDKDAAGWEAVTKTDCPVDIDVRWKYSDGTYSSWEALFSGYVFSAQKSSTTANQQWMTLTLRDKIVRLQKPAAIVDYRHPPLDFFFAKDASGFFGGGNINAKLYGGQCVQEIIRMFLGDTVADSINGNGNYLRFFPAGHYPLLSTASDNCGYLPLSAALGSTTTLQPPGKGTFIFAPPFGEDALNWIGKPMADDHAIFFFGRAPGSGAIVPIYGRYNEIIASRAIKDVPDGDYNTGDINIMAKELSTATRPDRFFNRVVVYGNAVEGGLAGLIPAIRMAEGRLLAGDDNAAELSWEKTKTVRHAFAFVPNAAEAIAGNIMAEMHNMKFQWPEATVRGQADMQPGDVLHFELSGATSDATISLDGLYVRAENIEHTLTFDSEVDYWTHAACRPLTASEAAGLTPPVTQPV